MRKTYQHLDTKLVHAGEPEPRVDGAVVMPIFQTAMFETMGEDSYDAVRYIRLNNSPNHLVLHRKLAALENAEAAVVSASGMAAISTALLTVLRAGDHLLVQNGLYGGTHTLVTEELPELGIGCDFIEADRPDSWTAKLRPETKAIYVETIANPLLQIPDFEATVVFAREHGLVSLIDNTFASPVNFRPAEYGFDISLHSATKYLNGHTDIVAGAAIGKRETIEKINHRLNHLGGTMDPHAAFLLHRGMKTLALRVGRQNESALAIARFLEGHPKVTKVYYPGLESHSQHDRAKEFLDGFGGMVSFELQGGLETAKTFMQRTQIPIPAPSLGGVETLLTRPAATSHAGVSREDRVRLGITDSLVRISVGIEDAGELIADFQQALDF